MADATQTTDPPAGAAGDGKAPPASSTPPPDPPDMGEAGRKALAAERKRADDAQRAAEAAIAEAQALREKHQTAEEKAIADAKKAGAEEATLAANRRIVAAEIRAAAGGKVQDPEDVAALLGDPDRFIRKGEVDRTSIAQAIADLLKAKPYLAAKGTTTASLPGGGKDGPTGSTFNDTIRARIHGRRS